MTQGAAEVRRPVVLRGGIVLTMDDALGADAWAQGMNPDLPGTKVLDNPYQYTEYKSERTHGARGSVFGS